MFNGLACAFGVIKEASPKICFTIATATGILLFMPSVFVAALGLTAFIATNRSIIGVAFLVFVVLLITQAFGWIWSSWRSIQAEKRKQKTRIESLTELTQDELLYLLPYIIEGKNTRYFKLGDGVTGGLEAKGILYRASNLGSILNGFAFNMQPWARKYLSEHRDIFNDVTPLPLTQA